MDRRPPLDAPPPPPSPALAGAIAGLAPVRTRRPGRALAIVAGTSVLYVTLLATGRAAWTGGRSLRVDLPYLPVWFSIGAGLAWAAGFAALLTTAIVPRRGQVV